MQVPRIHRRLAGAGGCLAALAVAVVGGVWPGAAIAAEKSTPTVKLSLESLGVPALSTSFLDAGASMLTVNFLDDQHLLVTYSERDLVPRLPDDPKDDDDRMVAAEIVELPGGKVVAKTHWHMHDHARYLWAVGPDRFVVRIRNVLYLMTPLSGLAEGHPFARAVFPWHAGRPSALFTSEDGGMLTIESQVVDAHSEEQIEVGDTVSVQQKVTTLLDFYRVSGDGSAASPVRVSEAGSVRSPQPFYLPLDSRGYLWPVETGNSQWAVMYDDMRGKAARVGVLESTCTPRLEMVSHAVYIALTCRGSDDRVRMAGYGLDAQETWEEDFGDFGAPVFAYAPEAGRFAFSRRVSEEVPVTPGTAGVSTPDATVDRQAVRVYQSVSGELLLKVDAFPAMKTMENFSLAPDGSALVVVREGAVEVYRLPELKAQDKEDIAEETKMAPPDDDGPVVLTLLTGAPAKSAAAKETAAKASAVAAPAKAQPVEAMAKTPVKLLNGPVMTVRGEPGQTIVATAIPGGATSAAAMSGGSLTPATEQSGEVARNGKRKPPTLLYPGEHAEFGGSGTDVPQ